MTTALRVILAVDLYLGALLCAALELWPPVVPLMLAASVAALGLSTDLKALRARGGAPLLLGVGSSVFITVLALIGVKVIG